MVASENKDNVQVKAEDTPIEENKKEQELREKTEHMGQLQSKATEKATKEEEQNKEAQK